MAKSRSRRLAVRVGVIAACAVGLLSYASSAVAADLTTLHGSATVMNSCSVNVLPSLLPSTSHRVAITIVSGASPQPHANHPITLSNTNVEIRIGAKLFQGAVDSGFMSDGFTIPATVTLTLSGSNTTEAARTFSRSMTLTLHVVGGDAELLVATMQLPGSVWHPISPNRDVFFSEKSARIVLTLDLTSSIGAILVHTSTCAPLGSSAFMALGAETGPPPPPPPTSTTSAPPLIAPPTTGPIATALPRTGSTSGYATLVGLTCVAAGTLLIGRSRKRRPE